MERFDLWVCLLLVSATILNIFKVDFQLSSKTWLEKQIVTSCYKVNAICIFSLWCGKLKIKKKNCFNEIIIIKLIIFYIYSCKFHL